MGELQAAMTCCNNHQAPRFPETHSSDSRYRGDTFGHSQLHRKLRARVFFSRVFPCISLFCLSAPPACLLASLPHQAPLAPSDAATAHKEEAAGIIVRARRCTTGPPDPLEEKLSPQQAQPPLLLLSTFTRKIHVQGRGAQDGGVGSFAGVVRV